METDKDCTPQIGDFVIYWKGSRNYMPSGAGMITDIGIICGESVAWIENCAGCVAFSHLANIDAAIARTQEK